MFDRLTCYAAIRNGFLIAANFITAYVLAEINDRINEIVETHVLLELGQLQFFSGTV